MAIKVIVLGVDREHKELVEQVVRAAVDRVGGLTAWAHLSESHREGLVAREGLSCLLSQAPGIEVKPLRDLTRVLTLVASQAGLGEIGRDKLTVTTTEVEA